MVSAVDPEFSAKYLAEYLQECNKHAGDIFETLAGSARETSDSPTLLSPRISPIWFLQHLKSGRSWDQLDDSWKHALIEYAKAISEVNRAERMLTASRTRNGMDLARELDNASASNWDPLLYPEWLLLEIESGITIRKVQTAIAKEMMQPTGHHNAVTLMKMGEGKSSVIVPMLSTALGDGLQLVEVVVAKPQSKQMEATLARSLGGLADRRIYFMPVSRALKFDEAAARTLQSMLDECVEQRGVLLVQPEHLLSFKLMALEASSNKSPVASTIMQAQDFLYRNGRAVIDEADEIYDTKFEIIYTMGSQRPIELGSARWTCIQQILDLVRLYAPSIAADSESIEISRGLGGSFPRTRLLKTSAEEQLIKKIAEHICLKGLEGFPVSRQSERVRDAVKIYITQPHLSPDQISAVEDRKKCALFTPTIQPVLQLIRGLLAGGVLAFALRNKRWRVNYGLMSRTPPTKLAVPFHAKDQGSARSEFAHPEVIIILTSLSYYYGGLSNEDLLTAFEHLMCGDQAIAEYRRWIRDAPSTPAEYRELEGVNLRDRQQCEEVLFPCLRYGKAVIDYFLGQIVFSKEMREWESKLSASGWDIGQVKVRRTTGFSGTNDSKTLLPLDVAQVDLPIQKSTNAAVLEYLLMPGNTVTPLPDNRNPLVSDAMHLLETIFRQWPPVRVILDAGALVLELSSRQVAEEWLKMSASNDQIKGAVFVDDDDLISVLDRKGRVEALRTSPLASQLDSCLVMLDEAHTRGIDLRLPRLYRAAVTLGPHLTKDKLTQGKDLNGNTHSNFSDILIACMRMRLLGYGQCVTFIMNREIENKIRTYTVTPPRDAVSVESVLLWSMSESFSHTRRTIPLWAVQGSRFLQQKKLWAEAQFNGGTKMTSVHAVKFLEDEAQTIEQRYQPRENMNDVSQIMPNVSGRLIEIVERCRQFDSLQFNTSALVEQQERELAPEMERLRNVQRPAAARPANPQLHQEVLNFMSGSVLVTDDPKGYMPAFESLHDTSASGDMVRCGLAYQRSNLLATKDFANTIAKEGKKANYLDSYQRPVQWILSRRVNGSNNVEQLMIISPMEAQRFAQTKNKSKAITLHIYKPRCNFMHSNFDNLDFLTVPHLEQPLTIHPGLIAQLNLFAGQLYLQSYAEYLRICKELHLATGPRVGKEIHLADGFIKQTAEGKMRSQDSPTKFLQTLLSTLRRHGTSITKTHVGAIIDGKILSAGDFE